MYLYSVLRHFPWIKKSFTLLRTKTNGGGTKTHHDSYETSVTAACSCVAPQWVLWERRKRRKGRVNSVPTWIYKKVEFRDAYLIEIPFNCNCNVIFVKMFWVIQYMKNFNALSYHVPSMITKSLKNKIKWFCTWLIENAKSRLSLFLL